MASHRQRNPGKAGSERARRRAAARDKRDREAPARTAIASLFLRHWRLVALWAMIAAFARYYSWTAWPIPQPVEGLGLYSSLTDAFQHGQTSLRVAPSPQLLALPDPYNPRQNARFRLHDASLYGGRYYLYFGPAPVVTLYLPYRLLTGDFLPDLVGAWLFAAAAFGVGCFLVKLLLEHCWPHAPPWMLFFFCGCLGFSNAFLFVLRRPAVYEIAIAAGQFFVLLALYGIARCVVGRAHPLWNAALGGAALAAAFGSRPQLVLAGAAFGWILILGTHLTPGERFRRLSAALAPFTAGFAMLLYYNYVRFHSPLEFGTNYMLSGFNVRKQTLVSVSRFVPDLWFLLLEPPRLQSQFPFIVLAPRPPFHPPPNYFGLELVAGIIWIVPLMLLLAAAPLVWRKSPPSSRRDWAVCAGTLAFLGAAWISVDALVGATFRYQADVAGVVFVAAALVAAGLSERAEARAKRWAACAIISLGLLGVMVNGAIGMTGYLNSFQRFAPDQYRTAAAWFSPVAKVLGWCGVPPTRSPDPAVSLE